MRHNFWKERKKSCHAAEFSLLPNFNLKKYDFNLYKGFFMEKNGPNLPNFYDKY
jgi:hypothetical protein